jgi:4-amino-4-deoxy-L-arabinose transferase-like glycosyltransferase
MISRDRVFDKIHPYLFPLTLLLGNILVACGIELAHDEAYYWLFSKNVAWGYFDHPPMAAWLIALTSWLPGEFGVRLSYVLLMQGAAWLLASMAPASQRWFVWLGVNIFPLLAFGGVFAIPDGPLVFFSVLWLWSLERSLRVDTLGNACLMGLATALLFYSKYHGVLFVVATLLALPGLLRRRTFWTATLFGLLLFLPHVHWQWAHDFATFRYHFLDRPKIAAGWRQPLEFVLIQIFLPGLFLGPYLWRAFWKRQSDGEFERALKFMALFVPLFFFVSTFSKKLEANWTVAAGLPLLLFVARGSLEWLRGGVQRTLAMSSLILVVLVRLVLVAPPEWHRIKRGHEFHGWAVWAKQVKEKAGSCHLAANRYQFASKLSFYLHEDVPALNVGTRLNQFEFWDWPEKWGPGDVCWVTERRLFPGSPVTTPDGKNLVLVKGVSLGDILKHKDRSL